MCKTAKDYLSVLRDYKQEIIMVIGFVMAFGVYSDFRSFIADTTKVQIQQTEVLRTIEMRLTNLEQSK